MATREPKTICAPAQNATRRVAALLQRATSSDETSDHFLGGAGRRLKEHGLQLGELEQDCLDWGAIYGLAFALIREEDPWETPASVAARADAAAWERWGDWSSGTFHERVTIQTVADVVTAYRDCPPLPAEFRDLEDALIGLANGCGWTKPK